MIDGSDVKYRSEYCNVVINMMKEGASHIEVAAEIGIAESTFYLWKKDPSIPEFGEAVRRGEMLSRAWWERNGRVNLTNKEFSPTLWYMNMRNRFGWSDKQEIEHTGKGGSELFREITVTVVKALPAPLDVIEHQAAIEGS